jgi:hypothetical protein
MSQVIVQSKKSFLTVFCTEWSGGILAQGYGKNTASLFLFLFFFFFFLRLTLEHAGD